MRDLSLLGISKLLLLCRDGITGSGLEAGWHHSDLTLSRLGGHR